MHPSSVFLSSCEDEYTYEQRYPVSVQVAQNVPISSEVFFAWDDKKSWFKFIFLAYLTLIESKAIF